MTAAAEIAAVVDAGGEHRLLSFSFRLEVSLKFSLLADDD